jgi:hypothetical protein
MTVLRWNTGFYEACHCEGVFERGNLIIMAEIVSIAWQRDAKKIKVRGIKSVLLAQITGQMGVAGLVAFQKGYADILGFVIFFQMSQLTFKAGNILVI